MTSKLYKDTKKQLKAVIKGTSKTVYQKALLSKNSKEASGTIYQILKANLKRIKVDPKALDEHLSTLATNFNGNTSNNRDEFATSP